MQKSLINFIFILLIFNTSLAQLNITQKDDYIVVENVANFSTEVFISESTQDNFVIQPGQTRAVSIKQFLTRKSLEEIKIASSYTFSAYILDTRLSIIETRDKIKNQRSYKAPSLDRRSITDMIENNESTNEDGLNKIIRSLELDQNYILNNKTTYESFLQLIEEDLIPNSDDQLLLNVDSKPSSIKANETQITTAKSYVFDFLNTEIDTNNTAEINYMADHYKRVKSCKKNYENSTIVEYGSLKELGFKVFENSSGRFQFSLVLSGLAESIGSDISEELIYNFNPEIGIRTSRFRVGKNLMIENNLNIGYSYYVADKLDERIVIQDVVNNIEEVYDEYHLATLGLDLILKGGVKKPSLIGIGAEGGATYLISNTFDLMPNVELTPENNTDLGYYFGGFIMVGNKFNVKLGFRRYDLWYRTQGVNRNYLNTALIRLSLTYKF